MCLPGGRERRIVHGRDGHLQQRALARAGRTWRRPRRAPRIRCSGQMCIVARCCGPGAPGERVNSGRPVSARLILQRCAFACGTCGSPRRSPRRVALRRAVCRNVSFGIEIGGDVAAPRSPRRPRAPRRVTRPFSHHDLLRPAHWCGSRRPLARAEAAIASDTAPMPPRTNPHKSAMAVHAAHAVVQQDVGGAGRARAAVGADHAVGGQRHLDLFGFEPLVQKFRGALREDLDQRHHVLRARGRASSPASFR